MKKILLVKPGSQKQLYGDLSTFEMSAIEPPLWAALLAGYLRNRGIPVNILDAEVEGYSYKRTAEMISHAEADYVVITVSGTNPSASTMNMLAVRDIVSYTRELTDVPIGLHGIHPTAIPEQTFAEENIDFIIGGEGFYALERLGWGYNDLIVNDGKWTRNTTKFIMPENVKNLSQLPNPAWDLLPMSKYRCHNWHRFGDINNMSPYGVIYTSLGCPFKCDFCCINALFGVRGIRFRSPIAVVDDIQYQVETWGTKKFKFVDEMFTFSKNHVTQICDLIIMRGLIIDAWAYARAGTVDRQLLDKMKQAGINWVGYGFESGNQRVLDEASKGVRLESIYKTVHMTREAGVHLNAAFIVGMTGDDYHSMNDTLSLMLQTMPDWINLYSVMPYPGSLLYKKMVESGKIMSNKWNEYSQYSYECTPLGTEHLTPGQVVEFRDYAFTTFFRNPGYLDMIEKKFGIDTRHYITKMVSTPLLRKLFNRREDDQF